MIKWIISGIALVVVMLCAVLFLPVKSYQPSGLAVTLVCPATPIPLNISENQPAMKMLKLPGEGGGEQELFRFRWMPPECAFPLRRNENYPSFAELLDEIERSSFGLDVRFLGFFDPSYAWEDGSPEQQAEWTNEIFWDKSYFVYDADTSYSLTEDELVPLDNRKKGRVDWKIKNPELMSDTFIDQLLANSTFEDLGYTIIEIGKVSGGVFDKQNVYLAVMKREILE